jgi:hypothetical protein
MFATITYNIAIYTTNSYGMILVQKSPVYYGETFVTFGYQLLLTLFVQLMGMGFAGYLRRFSVYPVKGIVTEPSFFVLKRRFTYPISFMANCTPYHCNEPSVSVTTIKLKATDITAQTNST